MLSEAANKAFGRSLSEIGFTLVELLIIVAIIGITASVGAPAFKTWVADTKTRTVAETLQNGLRLAQTEAVKRGAQVQLVLTDAAPIAKGVTPSTTGKNWVVQALKRSDGSVDEFIQGAALVAVNSTSLVSGPDKLTFNSIGRMVDPTSAATYAVRNSSVSDGRKLNVTVSISGKVRMCDVDKSLASSPDGC
jgi:type IV fimbrial biogenesis protein FimT